MVLENWLLWVSILFALTMYVVNWFVLHPISLFREFLRCPEKFLGSAKEVSRLLGVILYFISGSLYVCSMFHMIVTPTASHFVLISIILSVLLGLIAPIAMVISNNIRA